MPGDTYAPLREFEKIEGDFSNIARQLIELYYSTYQFKEDIE